MRICLLALFFSFVIFHSQSQSDNTQWKTVIYDSTTWRYFPGDNNPGATWMTSAFDDSSWQSGKGGFGYADNDDQTTLFVNSIFIRKKFTIINKEEITRCLLHVDYDDGFVAYLNGTEIARSNMADQFPGHTAFSLASHEAALFQGLVPEGFELAEAAVDLLVEGENTLAIQVHNSDANSSDLTIRPFLSVRVPDNSSHYYDAPNWFPQSIDFESSNLPIFVIDTHNNTIPDEPEIIAELGVIDNEGNRNFITDPFNGYHGNVTLELRGESSQMFPKKSLKMETVNSAGEDSTVSLLGLPPEDDWVLYAPYTDKTMLRDVFSYHLSNEMGHYASRSRFCELVINGEYMGVYILLEKIKQDKNRVDIAKLKADDIEGDDLTGGYILRVDKIDDNDFPAWQSAPNPRLAGEDILTFQYFDPSGEDLQLEQKTYIQKFITDFQSSLSKTNFQDPVSGYEPFIDVSSFVDFMLLNEVNKNVDAYIYSTYMHKDKDSNGGKLKMGPAWDFNLAFGNVDYWANSQFAPGWMYNDDYRMFWFRRLMDDDSFYRAFNCKWIELRQTIFKKEYMHQWIDSAATVLDEAQQRNFQRWPILGAYVWPNQFIGNTYQEEIDFLKDWITKRLVWMDNNLSDTCEPITAVDEDTNDANVYPNPSSTGFNFQLDKKSQGAMLAIYNTLGQLIFTTAFSGDSFQWNAKSVSGYPIPEGLYIYRIDTQEGKQLGGKIIKE